MKKKIFLDTNIIMDFALKRKPYDRVAYLLMKLIEDKQFAGITSAAVFTDLYYLISKKKSNKETLKILEKMNEILDVVPVARQNIEFAIKTKKFADFEDAVQYSVAVNSGSECIITRNKKDYKKSDIAIMDAEEFVVAFTK